MHNIDHVEKKTISDAEADRIQCMPALSTILPIVFANGAKVDDLVITCQGCNTEISTDEIRGQTNITDIGAAVDMYAVCYDCKLISPASMRFRDDGSMLSKGAGSVWHEGRYAKQRPIGAVAWCKAILYKLLIK